MFNKLSGKTIEKVAQRKPRIKDVGRRKSTLINRHNAMRLAFKRFLEIDNKETNANARRRKQIAAGTLTKANGLVV